MRPCRAKPIDKKYGEWVYGWYAFEPPVGSVILADIEIPKINQEDREILSKWRKMGYIEGGASGLNITKEFWDILCEIIFLGYVDLSVYLAPPSHF